MFGTVLVNKSTLIRRCALPKMLRSLNTFTGGNWYSRNKHWRETPEWMKWLRSSQGLGIPVPHGNRKRRVLIVRMMISRQRYWDDENQYGGSVKPLNDALVRLGWLKDDCPEWRKLDLRQSYKHTLSDDDRMVFDNGMRTIVEIHNV